MILEQVSFPALSSERGYFASQPHHSGALASPNSLPSTLKAHLPSVFAQASPTRTRLRALSSTRYRATSGS